MVGVSTREFWMSRAIRLARKGLYTTHPNPRVGCVIVYKEEAISEGFHQLCGGNHAEVEALKNAKIPEHCDIYVTLEPCSHFGKTPPCVDALIAAKPSRVIIAMQDPNPQVAGRGIALLKAQGIEVVIGVMEKEARQLNPGFISRMALNKPFLRLKMATSLDGATALKNGKSQWITGAQARRDVQYLRAMSSAILTTAKTVLDDDPALDIRLTKVDLEQKCDIRHPVRVIIDRQLCLTGNEKVFASKGDIWIYTLNGDQRRHRALKHKAAQIIVLKQSETARVDLTLLMTDLAAREINEIHTECGHQLAGALIKQNLVNEVILYMAPHLLGSSARGAFDLGELSHMKERVGFNIEQFRAIGNDMRFTLTPEPN